MTREQANEILDKVTSQLSEHFDAVQIVVCWLEPDQRTNWTECGKGLWHARVQLCQDFVEADKARAIAYEINKDKGD